MRGGVGHAWYAVQLVLWEPVEGGACARNDGPGGDRPGDHCDCCQTTGIARLPERSNCRDGRAHACKGVAASVRIEDANVGPIHSCGSN